MNHDLYEIQPGNVPVKEFQKGMNAWERNIRAALGATEIPDPQKIKEQAWFAQSIENEKKGWSRQEIISEAKRRHKWKEQLKKELTELNPFDQNPGSNTSWGKNEVSAMLAANTPEDSERFQSLTNTQKAEEIKNRYQKALTVGAFFHAGNGALLEMFQNAKQGPRIPLKRKSDGIKTQPKKGLSTVEESQENMQKKRAEIQKQQQMQAKNQKANQTRGTRTQTRTSAGGILKKVAWKIGIGATALGGAYGTIT